MRNASAHHADDRQLLFLADGELPAHDETGLRGHLSGCQECRHRFHSIESAGAVYLRYHGAVKADHPPPPRPWDDLRVRLEELEFTGFAGETAPPAAAPRRVPIGWPQSLWRWPLWRRALPLAAAVLIGVFVAYRMQMAPPVSAAELLRKAVAAEPSRGPSARIRVRARGRTILRPAVLRVAPTADRDVAALFAQAHYNYDDPLSARSFTEWRAQLSEKTDRVLTDAAGHWEIHTSTHASVLTEAVLTLRAADLHPLRETMRFGDDVVEIAEADAATPAAPPSTTAKPPSDPSPTPAPEASPSDELEVLAALHRIEADLGEPIEVTREGGSVTVTGTGLSAQREGQVRDAVSALPRVALRFEKPVSVSMPSREAARPPVAAALRSELGARLGEDAVDRVLDASEAVLARAFALRSLSRRFTVDVEAQLTRSARSVLANLREEHAAALSMRLPELESVLLPVLPASPTVTAAPAAGWQTGAARLLTAAQHFDQLMNRLLAGSGEPASPSDLATALRELQAEVRVGRQ